jgi:hypothetical protein
LLRTSLRILARVAVGLKGVEAGRRAEILPGAESRPALRSARGRPAGLDLRLAEIARRGVRGRAGRRTALRQRRHASTSQRGHDEDAKRAHRRHLQALSRAMRRIPASL